MSSSPSFETGVVKWLVVLGYIAFRTLLFYDIFCTMTRFGTSTYDDPPLFPSSIVVFGSDDAHLPVRVCRQPRRGGRAFGLVQHARLRGGGAAPPRSREGRRDGELCRCSRVGTRRMWEHGPYHLRSAVPVSPRAVESSVMRCNAHADSSKPRSWCPTLSVLLTPLLFLSVSTGGKKPWDLTGDKDGSGQARRLFRTREGSSRPPNVVDLTPT